MNIDTQDGVEFLIETGVHSVYLTAADHGLYALFTPSEALRLAAALEAAAETVLAAEGDED